MTGIERLREFAKGCRLTEQKAYSNAIADIADQIELDVSADIAPYDYRLVRRTQAIRSVLRDMERYVSGVEGMEDSPVARWARELRGSLGGRDDAKDVSMSAYDLLPEEEREAIAWVREHGGIAYVKDAWNVRSNLDRQLEKAQSKVERQQRHIEFVQRKCRERVTRCRDCAYASPCPLSDSEKLICAFHDETFVNPDDFCSWGKERDA